MHVAERVGQERERTRSDWPRPTASGDSSPALSREVQERLLEARGGQHRVQDWHAAPRGHQQQAPPRRDPEATLPG